METVDSFGYWIRRQRKALDMTQDDLARRVGCATVTLRKIEADERRPSVQMARRLAECLALPAEEQTLFMAAAVGQQAPARLSRMAASNPRRLAGNLPAPVTALVGRSNEVATISASLQQDDVRLVTLTGPVGVGKTRLALEVGWRLGADYQDGVFLVALAPVQDAALVPSATATALGVREARDCDLAQSLFSFLADRQILLIFDNFEHLLPAARFLSELLAECPQLQLLITSRARLHLYGEHEHVVMPLPLPARDDPLGAANTAAVRLFCARAQAARTDFQLTPSLTPVVAEICRRLDGLPLAIELAAARLKLLSLPELRARLEHPLPLLNHTTTGSPFRRQGLEDAIAWSYGLLSPAERALLARLAVFVGGVSLAAAEAVVGSIDDPARADTPDVTDGIQTLLDQSLLVRAGSDVAANFSTVGCCGRCPLRMLRDTAEAASRFSMLEIIREFALAQLEAAGEAHSMPRHHAAYFAAWAMQAAALLNGPDQATWLARLEVDADNLRAALAWLLAHGPLATAASMACALGTFWQRHGHYTEGRRWLEQVLAQMAHTAVPDTLRAHVLQTVASLAYRQGDWQTAQRWLGESLAIYRAADDPPGMARVLFDLGWIAVDNSAWEEAARLNEESLDLARTTGDLCAMYQALTNLGWTRLCVGDWETAAGLFDEAHTLAERAGHVKGIAVSLANLGWIALHDGDTGRAVTLSCESAHLCHLLGEREVLAECLEILADAAALDGNAGRAAMLHGAADGLWEALHVTRPPTQFTATSPGLTVDSRHDRPDDDAAGEKAWRRGRMMSLDAMVAYALGCGGAPARR